ncbi:MAG: GNAT family N-acetyltransferase [Gemmataceae bacterium]|nr:GNAT family N-acetyltransferase [Gemmataceae bacterium]
MNAPHSIRKAKPRPNNIVGYHSETMAGIAFRELRREDIENGFLEALAALTTVELDARTATDLFDRTPSNQLTFVAHKGDRIVGTTSLLIDQKYIHSGGRVGHIEDVAVVPDFQRRGIGTALVKHAVEIARARGCYKVILHCFSELSPFYQQLGFRDFNIGMRLDIPSGT